ncbi:serine hydrolase [Paenibacillus sp. FSL H3-0333]|uniref:serine hydrolase n=1 Tax=Paenibacillus sp. FSL H3-0333 TaxID=2921373 RepID=UPI0030FA22CA
MPVRISIWRLEDLNLAAVQGVRIRHLLTHTHGLKNNHEKLFLFVSARELAYWGYLHLNRGLVNGQQLVPKEVIEQATTNQSPANLDDTLPRNGFAWWIQDKPRAISEIGNTLPLGSYQILGLTGCACLVIPEHRIVAVRMYNQTGPNPPGHDYLEDIKAFGDKVLSCTLNSASLYV